MSEEVKKSLENEDGLREQDAKLVSNIVQQLILADDREGVPLVDRIQRTFRLLEAVSAICIADVSKDTDMLARLCTEVHEGVTRLAVMVFEENQRSNRELNVSDVPDKVEHKNVIRA